jgi:hypothetical protein
MKLNRKQTLIGAAVVIALAGGSYGAYTYISGLPKRLNKEEAAKRYLEIVCPGNALNEKINTLVASIRSADTEMKGISERRYSSQTELDNAEAKYKALGEKRDSEYKEYIALLSKQKENWKKASKQMVDPKYVWPDDVKESIEEGAAIGMELASRISDHIERKAELNLKEGSQTYSTIRTKLGLEERGSGCPKTTGNGKKV